MSLGTTQAAHRMAGSQANRLHRATPDRRRAFSIRFTDNLYRLVRFPIAARHAGHFARETRVGVGVNPAYEQARAREAAPTRQERRARTGRRSKIESHNEARSAGRLSRMHVASDGKAPDDLLGRPVALVV